MSAPDADAPPPLSANPGPPNSATCEALRDFASQCDTSEKWTRGDSNPRPIADSPEEIAISEQRAAPGAAPCAPGVNTPVPPDIDPALRDLIGAWAGLPEDVRRGLAAMFKAMERDR